MSENQNGHATSTGRYALLAYIACHLICAAKNLAVFAGILLLAYTLQSGWILWALLLCPWSRYKHDYNGFNCSSSNNPQPRRSHE